MGSAARSGCGAVEASVPLLTSSGLSPEVLEVLEVQVPWARILANARPGGCCIPAGPAGTTWSILNELAA